MSVRARRVKELIAIGLLALAVFVALVPLASVLIETIRRGAPTITPAFLLHAMSSDDGAGIGNAIAGTAILLCVALAIGLTLGTAAGVYITEHHDRRLARAARFAAEVLAGVPAIVIGIFAYEILVRPLHHFSAFSGGVALGVLSLPIVVRSTEEALKMVPRSLTEASLALGVSHWRTTVSIVLPAAWPALATGSLLAAARVSGEAAPLLFTALGDRGWPQGLGEPIASLPVSIYNFARDPDEMLRAQAWGAALVLVGLVLVVNVCVRWIAASRGGGSR